MMLVSKQNLLFKENSSSNTSIKAIVCHVHETFLLGLIWTTVIFDQTYACF